MTTFSNTMFPHFAVISRTTISEEPPFTATSATIWSGSCDCQFGTEQGGITYKRDVFVSDHTIFCENITAEIRTGDKISVTFVSGRTPVDMVVEQSETADIWQEGGKTYGTTIWAKRSMA
jgi:hypothetical protein